MTLTSAMLLLGDASRCSSAAYSVAAQPTQWRLARPWILFWCSSTFLLGQLSTGLTDITGGHSLGRWRYLLCTSFWNALHPAVTFTYWKPRQISVLSSYCRTPSLSTTHVCWTAFTGPGGRCPTRPVSFNVITTPMAQISFIIPNLQIMKQNRKALDRRVLCLKSQSW